MSTLAFDVYGTLINTHGLVEELRELVGDRASEFSRRWRDKQLEYSFRRSQMGQFVGFAQCTAEALDFTAKAMGSAISDEAQNYLLSRYRDLPAFDDAPEALAQLSGMHSLFAFSNGSYESVKHLLERAGILEHFDGIVSVEEIKRFKPDPRVYRFFLETTHSNASDTWLISGNPFDVLGADNCGMNSVWVNRDGAVFDPWGVTPSCTIERLSYLKAALFN